MSTSENKEDAFVAVEYFACECGDAFEDEESFDNHFQEKHTQIYEASKKPPKQASQTIIDYKCGECGQLYPTQEACMEHQEADHILYTEDVSQEEYDDVEGSGSTEPYSDTQLKIVQIELVTTPKPKKKRDQRKKVQCEICGRHYSSNAALWYHRKVHLDVKPFKCQYCPKAFTLKLYLQMHERIHTGEKPYQCGSCSKTFSNRGGLLRHDLIHTGLKPYKCPKCGKSFTQSNAMKLHYHTVHLKLPTPYKSYKKSGNQKRGAQDESQVQDIPAELTDPTKADEEVCYMETPAGRTIALKTIVPRKVKERLASLQTDQKKETAREKKETVMMMETKIEPKEEVYYYEQGESEEVAYEVVYQ